MGIDEVERGLALLSELSKNANSMKVRRSRHDEAPGLFSEFHRSLDGLIVSANNISGTVGANPNAVPHTIRTVFVDTMTAAEKTMSEVDNLLNVYCFESSGWFRAFVNTVKRFFLPKSSTAVMYDVKRHTVHLQSKLQHLWVRLVVHIFGEEMAAQIRQTIEESASPFDQLEAMPEIPPMMNKIQQATSLFETKLRAMTKGRQLHSAVSSSKPPPGRWRALGGGLQVSSLVLGHGPNGTVVYKGRLNPGDRPVAVKRLVRKIYNEDMVRAKIALLVDIDECSPYVVRFCAMAEDSEFFYIALELCSGTLGDRVLSNTSPAPTFEYTSGPAPIATVRALQQLLQGLADLHRAGAVHRNVKPQNVLLSRHSAHNGREVVKLADLELALRLGANRPKPTAVSSSGGGSGAASWQAPEMQLGERNKAASDIFSAGCVVYFVLTKGKHPFGDVPGNRNHYIKANRSFMVPLMKLRQPEAVDFVEKMIDRDYWKRPTAKEALFHPFFWSDSKKLDFLCDISDWLACAQGVQEVYNQKNSFKDWQKKIEKRLWDGSQYPSSPTLSPNHRAGKQKDTRNSRLLRAIRNWKHHYHDLPDDLQELLGPPPVEESTSISAERNENGLDHNLLRYFTSRVPNVVIFTYEFALKHRAPIDKRHRNRYFP